MNDQNVTDVNNGHHIEDYEMGQNPHQFCEDDPVPDYEPVNFKSEEDDASQAELFAIMAKQDKIRKAKLRNKDEIDLDVHASKIDAWVDMVNGIVHLADVCEKDGSLDPHNLDNILINVFKMKQLTEHVRIHSNYVVKYGKAGISVPYSAIYTDVSDAIEHVKLGLTSDRRLTDAIATMFMSNKSLITIDNDSGLSIDEIIKFKKADDDIDHNFDIEKKLIHGKGSKTQVINNMLNIVDIAASLFVIQKAEIGVESNVLVVSSDYKRTLAFINMCEMLSSMIIMFIDNDTVNYSLLDRRL